jgi:hypothetical protein
MMKTALLVCVSVFSVAHAEDFARTAVGGPDTWKRYELRGIELGMSRKALLAKGFKCGPYPGSRCWKLVDDRCKKARCELKEDAFDQWFELNGAKMDLDYMTCATTDSDAALVYEIRLQVAPRQLVTPASALGKALIKKYGDPTDVMEPASDDPQGGGRLIWWNPEITSDGPSVTADCTSPLTSQGYTRRQCILTVSDSGIIRTERVHQEEIIKQKMLKKQPKEAPSL